MTTICFHINDTLQIFKDSELVSEIKPLEGRVLNLADRFEFIWLELHDSIKHSEYYLLIGPIAGFTDTRIIYTWIKTVNMLEGPDYFVHKVPLEFGLEDEARKAKLENNKLLQYSKEPNIG